MAIAYIEVPLGGKAAKGRTTLVDIEDYEAAMSFSWHVSERKDGAHKYGPYAKTTIYRKDGRNTTLSLHQLIAGERQDHINGDGLDNRRDNLRTATKRQNQINRKTWGRSPYRGVSPLTRDRWQARITRDDGVRERLGIFTDQVSAAQAYDKAAKVEYGEFARLNFEDAA